MNSIRRFVRYFLDSPTYGRDRARLISGFSVGTAGLLLNAAVLLLVMPILLAPNEGGFRNFTDRLEFGQWLSIILLGGATAFATLLIPLRLVTVFWEPRSGRYFDQIVLSGISPLRFVIGKAASQNLFLALTLFLLLPYLVFSLTIGGVDLRFLAAGLFLVWLYCMELALVTLWLTLYVNELIAALMVIVAAGSLCINGSRPWQFQPLLMTPFPTLIHPVIASQMDDAERPDFLRVFGACSVCMSFIILVSLTAIFLGPLYGIIRENSTFGEVVREGDNKRKRWFRFRMHIQRSSEIAFFYENRNSSFLRSEGLLRWGAGFFGLVLLSSACFSAFVHIVSRYQQLMNASASTPWIFFEFHSIYLTIHGIGLVLAVILFSHAKNTTYLRVPFFRGRTVEVSKLDTSAFLLFVLLSTAASICLPFLFERYIAAPRGYTIFPVGVVVNFPSTHAVNFVRIAIEGNIVITIAGIVVYAFQRLACLTTWSRCVTSASVGAVYSVFFCSLPIFVALMCLEVQEFRSIPLFANWAPTLAATSPFAAVAILFNGQLGPRFPGNMSTTPFYVIHAVALCLMLFGIRRSGRKLRQMYLPDRRTIHG